MVRISRAIGFGYLAICLLALGALALIGPLGYAPLRLAIGPASQPVELTIWYGTEKDAWLKDATARFAASEPKANGRPIIVRLRGLGSGEIVTRVAAQQWNNEPPPAVVSPASTMQLTMLSAAWQQRGNTGPLLAAGAEAPEPLVLTPLVVVSWDERAKLIWPNGSGADFWDRLHTATVARSWSDLGGKAEWGPVKLGHTSPLLSNSGAQSLVLLAYGYHKIARGLDTAKVSDPAFQRWLLEVEQGVPQFGESTGSFMDDLIRKGPSAYDAALVYESLAIGRVSAGSSESRLEQAQSRNAKQLRIFYPPGTLLSDHPYATLTGSWVSADQRAAAAVFRRFLLSEPIQALAVDYGFRPVSQGAAARFTSEFARFANYGFQSAIPQQVENPDAQTINALMDLWQRTVSH